MATYKSIKYIIPVEAVEHTDSINALSDVDTVTTPPTDYQILVWSAADSKWYPGFVEEPTGTQKAIFGFGRATSGRTTITNLVSNTGVVSTDTTGVGTVRSNLAASGFGVDKAIFGFGYSDANYTQSYYNMTNLVSNTGVVATDTTGVGTGRNDLAAACYGGDKAIFGFGYGFDNSVYAEYYYNITNLVTNTGIVGSDQTGVGTGRSRLSAASYGGDKAIFGFGYGFDSVNYSGSLYYNVTNLVSSSGVVATDTTGVGTGRSGLAATGYGGDKAMFGFGSSTSGGYTQNYSNATNLVSNTGVVSTNTTGVGTARSDLAASGFGGDKALFAFGGTSTAYAQNYNNMSNLISNTGVVATDTTGVGTGRYGLAAAGFSIT